MRIGYIGLGKMGAHMCERLLSKGHEIVAFDPNEDAIKKIASKGAESAKSGADIVKKLSTPRVVWLMVPHAHVSSVLDEIQPHLAKGDVVIDGGNSLYKESRERAAVLKRKGIFFLDAGISGGPKGALEGACVMVGGDKKSYEKLETLFRDIAAPNAYDYCGASGAGHFVKMVHNGIEYGMMQSLAEGFALLKKSPFKLNVLKVAHLYNHRSVIESRLVGWLIDAYEKYGQDLHELSGTVGHSGEGAWTVEAGKKLKSPTPSIELALNFRKKSSKNPSYIGKILSGLRHSFGGHAAKKK